MTRRHRRRMMAPKKVGSKAAAIQRLLREARQPDVVTAYLRRRGLAVTSEALKGYCRCPYYDASGALVGTFRAVIAPILGPDGTLQSVQRIYDADLDPRKKIMSPVDTISGGAVRLHRSRRRARRCRGRRDGASSSPAIRGSGLGRPIRRRNQSIPTTKRAAAGSTSSPTTTPTSSVRSPAYNLARRLSRDGVNVEIHVPPDRRYRLARRAHGGCR